MHKEKLTIYKKVPINAPSLKAWRQNVWCDFILCGFQGAPQLPEHIFTSSVAPLLHAVTSTCDTAVGYWLGRKYGWAWEGWGGSSCSLARKEGGLVGSVLKKGTGEARGCQKKWEQDRVGAEKQERSLEAPRAGRDKRQGEVEQRVGV